MPGVSVIYNYSNEVVRALRAHYGLADGAPAGRCCAALAARWWYTILVGSE